MQQEIDYHLIVVPGLGQLRAPVCVSVQDVLDSLVPAVADPDSGDEINSLNPLD